MNHLIYGYKINHKKWIVLTLTQEKQNRYAELGVRTRQGISIVKL